MVQEFGEASQHRQRLIRSARRRLVILVASKRGTRTLYPRRFRMTAGLFILVADERDSGTTYPEPRVIQLPATTHFFGSKGDRVTRICDTEAPTADQDAPTLKPD
jgi:hypothetical protein